MLLALFIVVYSAYEWKQSGYFDPMVVLLLGVAIFGAVVCFLWTHLAIRWRKRDKLETESEHPRSD